VNVVRVLPDVLGLDKRFDYLIPERFADRIEIGSLVRIPLHGRHVGGWVVEVDPVPERPVAELKPITGVTGYGPDHDIVELSQWAAWRWAGRQRQFLVSASAHRAIRVLGSPKRTGAAPAPSSPATTALFADLAARGDTVGTLRLPPNDDQFPALASAVALGPTLVVGPDVDAARLLGIRLRRAGLSVASLPEDWALARAGCDVVIGARSAAWAPCRGLVAAVLLDEHDEALQSEASPTWQAREVLIERCRRSGARLILVSPTPSQHALIHRPAVHPSPARERASWPIVEIVDRAEEPPMSRSLVTSALIPWLRDRSKRVVCVINTTGRARLLACRSCRGLARCETCDAALSLTEDDRLGCGRCGGDRPVVCTLCGAGAFVNLRPGVTRLREELEAAAARPVMQITAATTSAHSADVVVGTEAALHRVEAADVVVFLDADREVLAPRYRALEQFCASMVRAARLVGRREAGGRILVQTSMADHRLWHAFVLGEPSRVDDDERRQRLELRLPPFGALAEVAGPGGPEFMAGIAGTETAGMEIATDSRRSLIRAENWQTLCDALAAAQRPTAAVRIAVDPPRV